MILVSNQDSSEGTTNISSPFFFRQDDTFVKKAVLFFSESESMALIHTTTSQGGNLILADDRSARRYCILENRSLFFSAIERFFADMSAAITFLNAGDNHGNHLPTAQPASITVLFREATFLIAERIIAFLSFCNTSNISSLYEGAIFSQ